MRALPHISIAGGTAILLASTTLVSGHPLSTFLARLQIPFQEEVAANNKPLFDGIMPGSGSNSVLISDVLDRDRAINIFSGFTRDIDSPTLSLDSSGSNYTVLAPLNKAITALPRKPWEDPEDYSAFGGDAYSGDNGQQRANRNLRRFVEAHVVPKSPLKPGDKVNTLHGGQIEVVEKQGKWFVQPGEVEVVKVADSVNNGEIWVLSEVLNYSS